MPSRTSSRSLAALAVSLLIFSVALAVRQTPQTADDPGPLEVTQPKAGKKYWKGNLHTHSLWSDGDDFPEMIADWYKRHGYDFLTLSEHNVIADGERWIDASSTPIRKLAMEKYAKRFGSHWVETRTTGEKTQVRLKPLREFRNLLEEPGRFLLIPGEEITHAYSKRPVHMNAINLRDVIKPLDGPSTEETIRVNLRLVAEQRKNAGWPGLAFLNHPNFGWGVTAEDMLPVEELRFFEVYNGHPGVRNYGDATHASCERIWDILNAVRLGKMGLLAVLGVATDDAHGYHTFGVGKVNPGRGWMMVAAPYLSAEAITQAMLAGDCYLSSGVTLTAVEMNEGRFRVAIQPEPGVSYRTEFIATMKSTSLDGTPMTGDDGNPLNVTRRYDAAIGKVVGTSDSLESAYQLTGDELYVRARITSTKAHPNPYQAGDTEMAWTQPMVP